MNRIVKEFIDRRFNPQVEMTSKRIRWYMDGCIIAQPVLWADWATVAMPFSGRWWK